VSVVIKITRNSNIFRRCFTNDALKDSVTAEHHGKNS